MRYCTQCVQPDTRPQIVFDEQGVCPACRYAETLRYVDWEGRKQQLLDFCAPYRANHGEYDCLVGVSGGKDSTRQALYVRDVLKMNPLLVSMTYPPQQQTERGAHNLANLAEQGFDVLSAGASPQIWKKLVRKGFFEHGNWARSTELALFSYVPRMALAYQIPLIFWGENPMLTLGEVSNTGRNDGGIVSSTLGGNTLGGGDIRWMLDEHIQPKHLIQYQYPEPEELEQAGLRFVYLGYYWKTWSKGFNASFSGSRGLEVRRQHPLEIGDELGVDALDDDWVALNQMLKYYKFGFGKVTDNVNERIRQGELTRDEAFDLVRRYDGRCSDAIIDSFCDYIECSTAAFWQVVERYVNPKLFKKCGERQWQPLFYPHQAASDAAR
jgi:N-acetyl sugar amidotransferase